MKTNPGGHMASGVGSKQVAILSLAEAVDVVEDSAHLWTPPIDTAPPKSLKQDTVRKALSRVRTDPATNTRRLLGT